MIEDVAELERQNTNSIVGFVWDNRSELFGFTVDLAIAANFAVGAVDALRGGNDLKKRAGGIGAMAISLAFGSLYGGSKRY